MLGAGDLRVQRARERAVAGPALEKAEAADDHFATFRGISEMRRNLELLGELRKELDRRPVLNLSVNPEWLEVRTNIVLALERHPEARESVLQALESAGSGNGR